MKAKGIGNAGKISMIFFSFSSQWISAFRLNALDIVTVLQATQRLNMLQQIVFDHLFAYGQATSLENLHDMN